jgi:lipopolysaccharide transport system permease protein
MEPADLPLRRLESSRGRVSLGLSETWDYRELLYFLVWRDVKVRYKQTLLGVLWAIIQPLLAMVVFSIFFGKLGKMPSDGIPYPLFSFAALVPWTFFASGLMLASNSLVGSQNLIKKIYFPRLIIPLSSVLSGGLDFAISLVMLGALMAYYGVAVTWSACWVLALAPLVFVTALGAGLVLSALNVEYRDVRYVLPFLTQLWLFLTPIAYPSSMIPEPWKSIYGINPMAGVVEGFRWALLDVDSRPGSIIAVSTVSALLLLAAGVFYFRKMERTFADRV